MGSPATRSTSAVIASPVFHAFQCLINFLPCNKWVCFSIMWSYSWYLVDSGWIVREFSIKVLTEVIFPAIQYFCRVCVCFSFLVFNNVQRFFGFPFHLSHCFKQIVASIMAEVIVVVVDPTPPTCCQQSPAPESCGSQQSLPPGGKERLHFVGIRPEVIIMVIFKCYFSGELIALS